MVQKIEHFYLGKRLLIFSSVMAICCYLVDALQATFKGQESDYAWIFFGLSVLLLWSFLSGQVNVQKMMFGAVLLAMVKEQSQLLILDYTYYGKVFFMNIFTLSCTVAVFVIHLIQEIDDKGGRLPVFVNQLLGLVGLIFLVFAIINFIAEPASFEYYIFLLGYVFNSIMVICMETRIAAYERLRFQSLTEGTWTDDKKLEARNSMFKLMEGKH